jgi:hypothetical protein
MPSRAIGLHEAGGEAREFFASIAAQIEGFFYRCANNPDWTMLRMTSGFDRVFGHNAAHFVRDGLPFASLIHPADLPIVAGAVEEALMRDINWVLSYRLRNARGRYVRVHESGGAVRDPQSGEVLFLNGVILDAQRLT